MSSPDKPKGAFSQAHGDGSKERKLAPISKQSVSELQFEQVLDPSKLMNEWRPLFVTSFPDEDDREPDEQLLDRLKDPVRNKFHLLRDKEGNSVGMEMLNRDPDIPGPIYVPYAAVAPETRGMGIYPKMAALSDKLMKQEGAEYMLYDLEDPKSIHEVFDEEPGGPSSVLAARRLHFWRRMGTVIVDDPDLPYFRPASSDDQKTQSYDLLSFRALGDNYDKMQGVFNEDGTQISKTAYRKFYLEMMRLQYGNKPEDELRREYPAVEKFLSNVDQSPKQWVQLHTDAIRPKASPDVDSKVEVVTPPSMG